MFNYTCVIADVICTATLNRLNGRQYYAMLILKRCYETVCFWENLKYLKLKKLHESISCFCVTVWLVSSKSGIVGCKIHTVRNWVRSYIASMLRA